MKALIVGHGSIGKRRARDLAEQDVEIVTADPLAEADEKEPLAAIRKHAKDNLVVVASPSSDHYWQALQAIDAGAAAVLVEKPPAYCAGDWEIVVRMAAKRNVRLAVAFNYRHHVVLDAWRKERDAIGLFVLTAIDDVIHWPTFGPQSYVLHPRYGGVLLTSMIHAVDLAVHLFGEGQVLRSATVPGGGPFGGIGMAGLIEIQHQDARSIISGQWFGPPSYSMVIGYHKTDGTIVRTTDFLDFAFAHDAMHKELIAAFINYAKTGEPGILCTGEQALPTMRIMDAVRA